VSWQIHWIKNDSNLSLTLITLNVVDLPAPLSPLNIPIIDPARTLKLTSYNIDARQKLQIKCRRREGVTGLAALL
jgi:hypothetical protein